MGWLTTALNNVLLAPLGVRLVDASRIERLNADIRALEEQRARDADRQPRDPLGTWLLAEVGQGRRLWVDLGDYGVSRPAMAGEFEPIETGFVQSVLKPGHTFVDIGANIGWFTILAAEIVGDAGRVHAFEPRPNTCERLRMSVAENRYQHVEVRQVALGAAPARMTVAALVRAQNPGGTWLLATEALSEGLREGHERFEVDVIRLDDLALANCHVLKIDIEGAEQLALSGAVETLKRCHPIILSEINPEPLQQVSGVTASEYVRFVEALGYRAHAITAAGPGPRLPPGFADGVAMMNVAFLPD
jgi:FkbM family methyltransferase